jgi:ABC-type nickel/cobalt efflux system permease component RcnA
MFTTRFKTDNPILFGLSFMAGIGITLMIVVAAIGVIDGASADSASLGLFFWLGLALLVCGVVGWFGVTRPDQHFDDINQPLDDGHGHGHDEAHDDHALPASTEKAIEPAHH